MGVCVGGSESLSCWEDRALASKANNFSEMSVHAPKELTSSVRFLFAEFLNSSLRLNTFAGGAEGTAVDLQATASADDLFKYDAWRCGGVWPRSLGWLLSWLCWLAQAGWAGLLT